MVDIFRQALVGAVFPAMPYSDPYPDPFLFNRQLDLDPNLAATRPQLLGKQLGIDVECRSDGYSETEGGEIRPRTKPFRVLEERVTRFSNTDVDLRLLAVDSPRQYRLAKDADWGLIVDRPGVEQFSVDVSDLRECERFHEERGGSEATRLEAFCRLVEEIGCTPAAIRCMAWDQGSKVWSDVVKRLFGAGPTTQAFAPFCSSLRVEVACRRDLCKEITVHHVHSFLQMPSCPTCRQREGETQTEEAHGSPAQKIRAGQMTRLKKRKHAATPLAIEPAAAATKSGTIPDYIQALRAMDYADYLQTFHWQRLRELSLKRDGYACRVCNGTLRLELHHRTYDERGFENLEDMVNLCHECHELFHTHRKLVRP
jgi:hypothetical protein